MEKPSENKTMPLMEHFRELKKRVFISVISLIAAICICYIFSEKIYQFLLRPLADLYNGEEHRRLIFTGLAEAFITYIKLSMFGGFLLSFPVIATQIYLFIAPGLYKHEKKTALPFLFASPVLFLAGAALAYYFIFPLAWKFFLSFETMPIEGGLPIQLEARISDYLSLATSMILAFGLAFQLPLILIFLSIAGLLTSESLKKKRKYAIVAIVIIAAIITPPDVISQIGLAIPLLLLYECSVFICSRLEIRNWKLENGN